MRLHSAQNAQNWNKLITFSRTFEIRGRTEIGLKFFGSNLDPFLNSGFSLDTLQDSETADSEINEISNGFRQYFGTTFKKNARQAINASCFISVELLKNIHNLSFVHMRKSKRPIRELNVIVVISDIIRIVLRGGSWKPL